MRNILVFHLWWGEESINLSQQWSKPGCLIELKIGNHSFSRGEARLKAVVQAIIPTHAMSVFKLPKGRLQEISDSRMIDDSNLRPFKAWAAADYALPNRAGGLGFFENEANRLSSWDSWLILTEAVPSTVEPNGALVFSTPFSSVSTRYFLRF